MRRLRSCAWAESHEHLPESLIKSSEDFSMLFRVGILDFGLTHVVLTPVKSTKHVIAFFHNTPQRPHMDSSTQNLTENLMMSSTCLWSDVLKKFIQKTSKNPEKFMKIRKNSKKISIFLDFSMCSFIIIRSKNDI